MQQPNAYRSDDYIIHEYLEVTGAESNMLKFQKVMLSQMRKNLERVIAERMSRSHIEEPSKRAYFVLKTNEVISNFIAKFEKKQRELMPFEELEKKVIGPIIRKHFTDDELNELISFYKSPIGKKYVASINSMMQEISIKTNQEYGQKLYDLARSIAEEELDKFVWQPPE
jgi:uncharacterized protein